MPRLTAKAVLWIPPVVLTALVIVGYAGGWWQQIVVHIVFWQGKLYHALVDAISALDQAPDATAWRVLLGVSFGYGVFHAAGPGHGKVVLSTYLASQGGAWRRALGLSVLAALLQGLMAIALIAVLVFGFGWLTRQAMGSVEHAELASFLMVTLVGLWLCWRSLKRLRLAMTASGGSGEPAGHAAVAAPGHGPHCGCGHDHHIAPDTAGDWRVALLTVLSIGVRPCSGAVLLLGAAALLDQFGKGVVAVMAMACGTALTVATLALVSVVARDWVARRLRRPTGHHPWQAWIGLAGGAVILVLGLTLTLAQWRSTATDTPPLLGGASMTRAGEAGEATG
ncbi:MULTISPECIES: nickel/cobalt transporter [unclassified Modicisalibacter]|uniref:nickel/cobalt transporter n=1 Tax=unclassified Modicisalibacter TaxID=2679913 RepID=UPI001CC96DCE|nr:MULTISPECIES: nickel/cobalt transporter [unclassified Modicisalibacter]MBZ9558460.1 nickel/cobalt transporter [Modicisalibacter sp. R2A 31.J]MBZ9575648.1 nickel/cobalt transporter [Modicisalibacter sp. MOD 31.J]